MRIADIYRLSVNPRQATEKRVATPRGLELSVAIGAYKLVELVADGVETLIGALSGRARRRGDDEKGRLEA